MLQILFFLLLSAISLYITIKLVILNYEEIKLFFTYFKNEEARAKLANDPKHFHTSIIYLMGYMLQSEENVQSGKIEFISRYITEVCPKEYRADAATALAAITKREIGSGKYSQTLDLVNVEESIHQGRIIVDPDACGSNSHYVFDFHGTKLAEELGLYLCKEDKQYIMFMLLALACTDNKLSTRKKNSEEKLLYNLCVNGLKLKKSELDELINYYIKGNAEEWYNNHFHADRYAPFGQLSDIFGHGDFLHPTSDKTAIGKSSLSNLFYYPFILGAIFQIVLAFIMLMLTDTHLMTGAFDFLLFSIPYSIVFLFIVIFTVKPLQSSEIPILRTRKEDWIQLRNVILGSATSLSIIIYIHASISTIFFIVGNMRYDNHKDTIEVTRTITGWNAYYGKNNEYYAHFTADPICFQGEAHTPNRPEVSLVTEYYLNVIAHMPFIWLKDIQNDEQMAKIRVREYDYSYRNEIKQLKVRFRIGYFGVIYYDGYEIEKHN